MPPEDLIFVGLNGKVAALDRETGEMVWQWVASAGRRYVTLMVDGKRLFVSVDGYTYCLRALTGEQLWHNPLTGYGMGPAALASSRGRSPDSNVAHAAADIQARSQSAG